MKKKYISPIVRMIQMESSGSRFDGLMAASLIINFDEADSGNADTEWGAKEHSGGISGEEGSEEDLW